MGLRIFRHWDWPGEALGDSFSDARDEVAILAGVAQADGFAAT
jgi:hypothetical protein